MKMIILVPMLMFLGCAGIIRDTNTYKAEVGFLGAASLQQADSIIQLVKAGCKCENGKFTTPVCDQAAHRALVVQARVPWHTAMMMYNARMVDDRPAVDPPAVPSPSSLCQ